MNSINQRSLEIETHKQNLIEQVHQKILVPLLQNGEINFSELKNKLDILDGTFSHAKKMFSWRERDNWEDAFIHQIEVVELYLKYSKNPTFENILILIDHDNIEDTDITVNWMKETHNNDNVVFSVALMTKDPFVDFINTSEDRKILDTIRKSWILNTKWNISDNFNDKLIRNKNITELEKKAYQDYNTLSETYKPIRNIAYSENMQTIEWFLNHASRININHWFNMTLEEIQTNIMNALECKLIDRLHWITTLWNCPTKKIERKIDETYTYYKDIALQFFPHLWKLIEIELFKAGKILEYRKINNITDNISNKLKSVFKHPQLTFGFDKDEK